MRREWECILGERVLFAEAPQGGWRWSCESMEVKQDPAVRYGTMGQARLAAAALIYAFFVFEEVTAGPVPPAGALYVVTPTVPGTAPAPPSHGGDGG